MAEARNYSYTWASSCTVTMQLVVCGYVLYMLQFMVQPPAHMQPVSGFLTPLYEYSYKQNICVLPR